MMPLSKLPNNKIAHFGRRTTRFTSRGDVFGTMSGCEGRRNSSINSVGFRMQVQRMS